MEANSAGRRARVKEASESGMHFANGEATRHEVGTSISVPISHKRTYSNNLSAILVA